MKLKYYLRGLGIGIVVTTIILMIAFSRQKNNISDEEVIKRAEALGMVMQEEVFGHSTENTESQAEPDEAEGFENQDSEPDREDSSEEQSSEEDGADLQEPGSNEENPSDADPETVSSPEGQTGNFLLVVNQGDACRIICERLQEGGAVDDAEAFRQYLESVDYAKRISYGNYEVPYGLSYDEIYQVLRIGPTAGQ